MAALHNRIIIATERERSFFPLTSSLHLKSRCASNWDPGNMEFIIIPPISRQDKLTIVYFFNIYKLDHRITSPIITQHVQYHSQTRPPLLFRASYICIPTNDWSMNLLTYFRWTTNCNLSILCMPIYSRTHVRPFCAHANPPAHYCCLNLACIMACCLFQITSKQPEPICHTANFQATP